jgi:hypothetical protein
MRIRKLLHCQQSVKGRIFLSRICAGKKYLDDWMFVSDLEIMYSAFDLFIFVTQEFSRLLTICLSTLLYVSIK